MLSAECCHLSLAVRKAAGEVAVADEEGRAAGAATALFLEEGRLANQSTAVAKTHPPTPNMKRSRGDGRADSSPSSCLTSSKSSCRISISEKQKYEDPCRRKVVAPEGGCPDCHGRQGASNCDYGRGCWIWERFALNPLHGNKNNTT